MAIIITPFITYMFQALKELPSILNLTITSTDMEHYYIKGFVQAYDTFLYQLIFDPSDRKLKPLSPYPDDFDKNLHYAGPYPLLCLKNTIVYGIIANE